MENEVQKRYLDLLKKALSFYLWPEPAKSVTFFSVTFPYSRKKLPNEIRYEGRPYYSAYADTMIGIKRLDNIQFCVESVLKDTIDGDFIETGVWRGGACIFMRGILAAYGNKEKKVFVADSFDGLPKPDEKKYPLEKGNTFYKIRKMAVSQEVVEQNFQRYGLLDEQVVFLKGWFKDTLPVAPVDKLSILRLDGDMYGSTWEALTSLYPKLQSGGYCIVDDYGAMDGCRKAVDDFRLKYKIIDDIKEIDWTGRYWRKS
jgi:O-methyltransferase